MHTMKFSHADVEKKITTIQVGRSISEMELYLINKGVHYQIYNTLGAQFVEHKGVCGIRFAVWAPNAQEVSLIGDFNDWKPTIHPMRCLGDSGVWELFVPELNSGCKYQFAITTKKGETLKKSDPMAFYSELRPDQASIATKRDQLVWTDDHWMASRGSVSAPINIYEVHLGSWKNLGEGFSNYRHIAHELAAYCLEMGYTHVELLPVMEHPLDESWGYQVTGFYAVTSRYGSLLDFQWFVNFMHQQGIGVILDWVPAHFPNDPHGLSHFDGTALYEYEDPRQGFHPHWNTHIFNYGRTEVANFLIGSALYWLDQCHVDGLRVDAVASMLYLNYGRTEGNWIPNAHGGHENLEAIEFLKHMNSVIKQRCPTALVIAEESSVFPNITRSVDEGGLGFTMKWNMGWMNDTLRFFTRSLEERLNHLDEGLLPYSYAFLEQFALPLSHDEVVHCKGSLYEKMPGDEAQKFAQLRLLLSCMMCHPGKKLLFMGGELAQKKEWDCKGSLQWDLLNDSNHKAWHTFVKQLNHFYLHHTALWECDFEKEAFEWIGDHSNGSGLVGYIRRGKSQQLLCLHNFSEQSLNHQPISSQFANLKLLFSTESHHVQENEIPSLSTLIFEVDQ